MASRVHFKSNESDSDESIPEIDICLKLNVQPYQHEPLRRKEPSQQIVNEDSDSEPSQIDDEDPTENENIPSDLDWCSCENCTIMPTARECKCCNFYTAIESRLEEASVKCITEHEGFVANCLNRWVLETSFY
nr:uncharacterized protein LOC117691123 [Crassostrea gigas]